MKIIKLIYIPFFCVINIFSTYAQSFPLKKDFLTYFVKDEITTHLNNLVDFEFDEYGRAWILLTNGLVLYDGKKYESIPFTQLSIPDYSFQELIKNPSGGLYLLGYKDFEGEEGIKLNLKAIALNTLLKSWVPIEQEFKSFNKEVLDLTNLYSFDNNKIGSISKIGYFYIKNKYKWEKKFKIPNLQINTIFPAKNNQWHAYSTNIYYRLDEKGDILFEFKVKSPFIKDFIEFKENKDKCFLQLKDELIFINENSMAKSEVSFTKDKSISLTNVLNLFIDSKGKFWLKYLNKVVVFDEKGVLFQEFPKINNIDLYWSGMFPIKEDNLGKIWIHLGDGFFINKQKQNDLAFYLKDKRYSFRGIQQINDSILYFNSYKGICLLNLNSAKITKKISSKYNYLGAFYDEPRKKIFLGSNILGFDVLNLENNKISEVKGNIKNGYHFIFLHKGLKNNYFWLGDFGFQQFDLKNEKLKDFIKLPEDYFSIYSFYEGNGFYLIGTDQGLLKYLPKYKKWIHLKNLPKIKVTGIVYAENKYFISTTGAGIILLDKNHELINNNKYDLRGINKMIFSMILDVYKGIWLGTENGLYYLNPRTIKHLSYSFLDGVHEKEFNWLSATNLKNGDIVMGTINGLVRFNPQKMINAYDDFQNGQIFFPSINIHSFTNTQNRNGLYEYLSKGKITLNPNEYSVTLNPGFTNNYVGKQPLFYVKIPNLVDWQLVRPFESITLNPKPGKSEITVRISSNNLNGEIKEIKIPVFKLQHILDNKTFLGLVLFLFFSLIGIIIFLRYRLLTGKNRALEKDLAIRVIDLELNEQNLIDRNNKLAILNEERRRFFDILGHEVNTPLAGMKQLSHTFNYLLNKGEYEKALKIAQSLEHSGNEISHLVDNLLTWSNLEKKTQFSKNITFNILDSFKATSNLFMFQMDRKNINYNLLVNDEFDGKIDNDPNIVGFIFRNILSNAIKYCPENGEINCSFYKDNGLISFKIFNSSSVISKDDFLSGIGIAPKISIPGTLQEKGLGIGLFMIFQLIHKIKGEIEFKIHEEGGVTAYISLKI
jgi:signal transduction histidine kinase